MDLTLELNDLRAEAESMMTDLCIVTRPGTPPVDPVIDPDTGLYPVIESVPVYTGKCSMRVPGTVSTGKTRPTAGDTAALLNSIFAIPADGPRLIVADQVVITFSEMNPTLAGLEYAVTGLLPASHVTKQRVAVEAIVY